MESCSLTIKLVYRSTFRSFCDTTQLVAPLTFEGSCNHLVFEKWLAEKLIPELKSGQTFILDNATFHQS
jgi:hypothetical protein